MKYALLAACAFLLDALFGDPGGALHPVCLIGKLIGWLEKRLRTIFPSTPAGETAAGVVLWLTVTGSSFCGAVLVFAALEAVSPWLRLTAEAILGGLLLARNSLCRAGAHVERALNESLEAGREAVGWYVGRDTSALTAEGVRKAAVETIAENTTDGVIAPLLYLLLGGAPLCLWYKSVNTLDSMVGYRSEKYEYFGKCSARMDDLANWIPARLAGLLLLVSAPLCGLSFRNALRIWRRDRRKHKSPNAGQTESIAAGALGVQLGGNAVYFGKLEEKAALGDALRPVETADIGRMVRLMNLASLLALALGALARCLL